MRARFVFNNNKQHAYRTHVYFLELFGRNDCTVDNLTFLLISPRFFFHSSFLFSCIIKSYIITGCAELQYVHSWFRAVGCQLTNDPSAYKRIQVSCSSSSNAFIKAYLPCFVIVESLREGPPPIMHLVLMSPLGILQFLQFTVAVSSWPRRSPAEVWDNAQLVCQNGVFYLEFRTVDHKSSIAKHFFFFLQHIVFSCISVSTYKATCIFTPVFIISYLYMVCDCKV